MTFIKTLWGLTSSLGGSVMSFISSSKSTYILLAILGVGGVYIWNDYQSLREDNGKLQVALEVAGLGTKEAVNIAESNANEVIKVKRHYQEILNELQRLGNKNKELEESLQSKEESFNKFKETSDDAFKRCLKTQLPQSSFGNLVTPIDSGDRVLK